MTHATRRRLVVTGHDSQGRSCVASDSLIEGNEIPGRGLELNLIWGADGTMSYPDKGAKPAYTTFFPPTNGFRMVEMYMPAKTFNKPPAGPQDNMESVADGPVVMDISRPGMHRSATIDMGTLVEGRIILQLDSGEEVTLKAGDVIVQSGTMHAWYNPFDEPARFIGVMVGARTDGK
jgi:hypothetical protein